MPTREDIAVVVLAGKPPTPALMQWVSTFPPKNVKLPQMFSQGGSGEMLALWRNSICRDFLANCTLPYLMMIDADAWPLPDSDAIIHAHGDILGVHAVGRHGLRAHEGDGEVGGHCIRISRHALDVIADSDAFDADRGWFAFPTKKRGTEIANCEDGYFCALARRAGFHPIKAAPMGHLVPIVVSPGEDLDDTDFYFPAQLLAQASCLSRPAGRPPTCQR
jgi:hypothetical protein